MRATATWLIPLLWGCLACERPVDRRDEHSADRPSPKAAPRLEDSPRPSPLGEAVGVEGATGRAETEPKGGACAAFRARHTRLPEPPFARAANGKRIELFGRARAVPVFFLETPGTSQELSRAATQYRRDLAHAPDPAATILKILRETRRDLSLRREVFLSAGYLFATEPALGMRLSQILRFDHLFDAARLRVWRGGEIFEIERAGERYRRRGSEADASLLLYDRVDDAVTPLPRPLHADFSRLQEELGFRSAQVTEVTPGGLWVEWTYGGEPLVETLTTRGHVTIDESGSARLDCEEIGVGLEGKLQTLRSAELDLRASFLPLKRAIDSIVELRLPFDEPRTEFGQEDGQLRRAFAEAYRTGAETYEYNGDRYYVFDNRGRVRLPEVCVDFITDAFDWATGGSWAPRGKGRKRVRGALHFPSLGMENHRSIESLALFAAEHHEWFDMYWIPKREQVRFSNRGAFFSGLADKVERLRLGDVVFINGLRDDERYHYHSFFLYEMDPLTGFPILLAANAGPPQMRTWEGEMSNAPRRFLVARLRVRPEIFRRAYEQAARAPGVPLSLPDGASSLPSPAPEPIPPGNQGG